MNVFVLNLDSRPDRWNTIKKRFSNSNSNFKLRRVSAVTNKVGSYGLFLSAIKAIKLAKKEGLSEVLILEDDCLPKKGYLKLWSSIKEWLDSNPDKWDIYSGGAHTIIMPHLIDTYKGIKFYDPLWCVAAHWIYIQKRSYDLILKHYMQYSIGAKFWYKLAPDIHNNFFKTIISYPFIAYQEPGFSNLRKTKRDTRKIYRNAETKLSKTS